MARMPAPAIAPSTAASGGFRRFWRTLRQIFHEVVGGVFAVLALAWANAALRSWTHDTARWLVGVAMVTAALMGFFSWTSFRRARRL